MNIVELYEAEVKTRPPQERFQLAKRILNDLPEQSILDESSEWTDEDLDDSARSTWRQFEEDLGEFFTLHL